MYGQNFGPTCWNEYSYQTDIYKNQDNDKPGMLGNKSSSQDIIDHLPVGVFYTDINGYCLYVNKVWTEIAGMTLKDALGEGWIRAIHPDDREHVFSDWNHAIKTNQDYMSEYRFQRNDGEITWVIGRAMEYRNDSGELLGYSGTITDNTDNKFIEDSLYQLTKGLSVTSGDAFFKAITKYMAETLGIDYAIVGELTGNNIDSIKSLAVFHNGKYLQPIEYKLENTPCETVLGKGVKGFSSGVRDLYPEFSLLNALSIESYVGSPLFDSSGKPSGIIAILNTTPIKKLKTAESLLRMFATRASAELERKQTEQLLEFKKFSIDHITESIFWTNKDGSIYDVNDAACKALRYSHEELLGLSIYDIDPNVSKEAWGRHWQEIKNAGKKGKKGVESTHKTKDGHIFPIEISANFIEHDGNEYHCSIIRDISERKKHQQERENNLSLLNAILEATADAILVVNNDGIITHYNQQYIELWNITEDILNASSNDVMLKYTLTDLKEADEFLSRLEDIYNNTEADSYESLKFVDGRVIERYSHPQKVEDVIVGRVWSFKDITETHKLSEQLSYQASHDPLTGLVNRREFERRLDRIFAAIDAKTEHVLCFMDLDNFKQVNDICGHIAGDHLLKKISGIFQQHIRGRDTLARLGGDEFCLVMEHCSIGQAEKVANKFIKFINEYDFEWEKKVYKIGVSIGIVSINASYANKLELMRDADIACYAAKKSGRNCIHISKN